NQGDAFIVAVRRKLGAKTHRRLPLKRPVARRQAWVLPATAAAAVLLATLAVFFLTRPKTALEVAVQPPTPIVAPEPKPKPPEPPPIPVVPPSPTPAPTPKPEPPTATPPVDKPAPVPEPPKPEPEPTPVPQPSRTVAVMATIESAGGEGAVQTDLRLIPGQELQTGSRSSHVVVKIPDGTRIHLAGDTHLKLVDAHNFTLSRGA